MNDVRKPGACLRLAYVSGPVDARVIHEDFEADREPQYFGTSYLKQLLQYGRELDARCIVVTTLTEEDYDVEVRGARLVNISPGVARSGLRFHLAMLGWAFRVLRLLWAERPDIAVLTAGQNYFFFLAPLLLRGTEFVLSLHCTLWPKLGRVPRSWAALRFLNTHLAFRRAAALQCVSQDVVDQVTTVLASRQGAPVKFTPTYSPEQFQGVLPPVFAPGQPVNILYVGRVEANKGVFDLIEIAHLLKARDGMPPFRIDICGDGAELEALRLAASQQGLQDICMVHGICTANELRQFYGASHIVVVPTRSDFEEGYNKVCAEAVLCGRPVVTSAACPALADIAAASIEVAADDTGQYADALFALATDRELYARKRSATAMAAARYLDPANSYGAVLRKSIGKTRWSARR